MSYVLTRLRNGWRLRAKDGTRWRHVPQGSLEARELGLSPSLSFEDAQTRLTSHRAEEKLHAARLRGLDARVKKEALVQSAWLPVDIVREFVEHVVPDENVPMRHWNAVQRLIAEVNLDPSEWRFRKKNVWAWFVEKRYSPDYAWRLIRVANLYQALYCARRQKAWSDLPMPSGPALVEIRIANRKERQGRQETFPLTLELLKTAARSLPVAEYSWLAVSLWFGLRVEEMKRLVPEEQGTSWYVDRNDPRFPVLWVKQWKLVREGLPEEEAWKAIPACEQDQVACLPSIEQGSLKMPYHRKLKTLVHERLSLRSGRAYFVTLMHGLGYKEQLCSKWLGHRSLSTTRSHYERTRTVYYEQPDRKRKGGSEAA